VKHSYGPQTPRMNFTGRLKMLRPDGCSRSVGESGCEPEFNVP